MSGEEVHFEKALEGVLNCYFRDGKTEMIQKLGIDSSKVSWYANYLPYGLEGKEIDYMVMESEDKINVSKISVIELMKGVIDEDHIDRCLLYSKWVADSLANGNSIVRPLLICSEKSLTHKKGINSNAIKKAIVELPRKYKFKEIEIFTYVGTKEGIEFKKFEAKNE